MTAGLDALAEEAARGAGAILVDHASRPPTGVETKSSGTDMVSAADHAAERFLAAFLGERRPDDGMIGEEDTRRRGTTGLTWVCDPLDGTTNFLYRFPHWAVSVAVEDAAGPVAACVYDPCRDEAFTATRGGGAFLDGAPIRVSRVADPSRALVATGFAYRAEVRRRQALLLADLVGRVRDVRRAGSAALDLAWTACGRVDGFAEAGLGHWDWAAGRLLVTEAGGVFERLPTALGVQLVLAGPASLRDTLAVLAGP